MKTKVFFVIPSLHQGGAERVISILSNDLTERGYQVFLVLLNASEHSYNLNPRVRIHYLNDGTRSANVFNRIYNSFKTFRKLAALISKERPGNLISFTTSANIWTGIMGNLFGISYMVSERSNPRRTVGVTSPPVQKLIRFLYKKAKAIVVPSRGIMTGLRNLKGFEGLSNFEIITNPVTEFKTFSLQRVHRRKYILSVGRLHPVKGFDRLIEAFRNAGLPDTDLLIVGEGSERNKLQKQIDESGLTSRVILAGSKDNVQDYYKQAEFYVLSSQYEGYPNVLIEAMSLGCPVIAVDCDFGPREIIKHGENGLLIPQGNSKLLSASIKQLANDEVLRNRFATRGTAVAQLNSVEAVVGTWDSLITGETQFKSALAETAS